MHTTLLILLILLITSSCSSDLHDNENTEHIFITLKNQKHEEVSVTGGERPTILFFIKNFRDHNSQNQLILFLKEMYNADNIFDADIYIVSKERPELLSEFKYGIELMAGYSLDWLSDPDQILTRKVGMLKGDQVLDGYSVISNKGDLLTSNPNESFGTNAIDTIREITKFLKNNHY